MAAGASVWNGGRRLSMGTRRTSASVARGAGVWSVVAATDPFVDAIFARGGSAATVLYVGLGGELVSDVSILAERASILFVRLVIASVSGEAGCCPKAVARLRMRFQVAIGIWHVLAVFVLGCGTSRMSWYRVAGVGRDGAEADGGGCGSRSPQFLGFISPRMSSSWRVMMGSDDVLPKFLVLENIDLFLSGDYMIIWLLPVCFIQKQGFRNTGWLNLYFQWEYSNNILENILGIFYIFSQRTKEKLSLLYLYQNNF